MPRKNGKRRAVRRPAARPASAGPLSEWEDAVRKVARKQRVLAEQLGIKFDPIVW